jgi:hypothetical protein
MRVLRCGNADVALRDVSLPARSPRRAQSEDARVKYGAWARHLSPVLAQARPARAAGARATAPSLTLPPPNPHTRIRVRPSRRHSS